MPFLATNDLLAAWIAALALVQAPTYLLLQSGDAFSLQSGDTLAATELMFTGDGIQSYSARSLPDALKDTLTFEDRVCFLVPVQEEYVNEIKGPATVTIRHTEILMLLADRDYGLRENALVGGDGTLGVLAMKDIIMDQFTGSNLIFNRVRLYPVTGESFLTSDATRSDTRGREGWSILWRTEAGRMETRLERLRQ